MRSLRRALLVVAILVFTATGAMFLTILDYESDLRSAASEDAMWAAYQLDRETLRLRGDLAALALDPSDQAQRDTVTLRFDILYSRLELLRRGEVAEIYQSRQNVGPLAMAVRDAILALDPVATAAQSGDNQALMEFMLGVEDLRRLTERFVLVNNQSRVTELVTQRNRLHAMYVWLGGLVLLQAAVMGAVITLQLRQNSSLADANRRLEQAGGELARAAEEAQAANRAKSEFLATISHEIRTPMNAMLGLMELLRASDLTSDQVGKLDKMRRAAMGLLHLINEVLDMASIEAGRLRIVAQPTAIRALIGEIVDLMEPTAQQKGLALTTEIAPGLPERLETDPGRLRQVLFNLVGNAVKFTDTGGVAVVIAGNRDDADAPMRLRVTVEDTGIGIPESARETLFQSFSTIESGTARRHGGAGLGLSISKRLIELIGGRIGYESSMGMGSRFWFEIPVVALADDSPSTQREAPSEEEPTRSAPGVRHLRVLVVEDNAMNREIVLGFLELLGHDATMAASGPEALRISEVGRFDVVLMDVRMPGMDGLEVSRRMRAMPDYRATVPIIALTANVMPDDQDACFAAGMTGFLGKPLDMDSLRRALNDVAGATDTGTDLEGGTPPPSALEPADTVTLSPRMAELRATLGPEGLASIAELFLTEIGQRQTALEAAARGPDWPVLREHAHAMKGMALDMGLDSLAEAARDLEQMAMRAKAGGGVELDHLARQCLTLSAEAEAAIARLRRLIPG